MKHIKNFFAMLVAMMMVLAFVACSSSDDDDDDDSVVSKSEDIISVAKKAATITVASADDLKLQSGVYKFAYDYVYDGEDEDEDDGVKYTRDVMYGTITVNSDKSTVIWEAKSSYSKVIFSDESTYKTNKSGGEKAEALIKGISFSFSDSALTMEASCGEEYISAVRDQDDSAFYNEDTYEEFINDLFDADDDLTTTVKQNSDGSKIYVYTTGVCDGVTETLVTALVKQ